MTPYVTSLKRGFQSLDQVKPKDFTGVLSELEDCLNVDFFRTSWH